MARANLIVVGTMFLVSQMASAASDTKDHSDRGGAIGANDVVIVDVLGKVRPRCALSGESGVLSLGELSKPGQADFYLHIDCNEAFEYRIESEQGGLARSAHAVERRGFSAFLPYEIGISVPTSGAAIQDQFDSRQIGPDARARQFSDSAGETAIDRTATLNFSWSDSVDPLLAGSYQDTITIQVRAMP